MFSTLFMLSLLVGGAYGVLLLFQRLSGVNMPEAACWSLKTRYFWIAPVWFLFYLWPCLMLMFLVQKPYTLVNMNATHTGALLGYAMSDDAAKLYDPVEKQYKTYDMNTPPAAASRFTDTFRTVVLYKPFLSGQYQNMLDQSYGASVIITLLAALGVMVLYIGTYILAEEYIKLTGLARKLTHGMLLDSFRQWTGYPLGLVLGGTTLFIVVSSGVGGAMVNRIMADYDERFQPVREDHQQEILARVAPGQSIKGLIVNRVRDVKTIYGDKQLSPPYDEDQHFPMATYTIEFKGLAKYVPVYLSIVYVGEPGNIPDRQRLDRLFPPEKSFLSETQRDREPREMADLDFIVNEDYSVSLAGEQ